MNLPISVFSVDIITLYYHVFDINHYYYQRTVIYDRQYFDIFRKLQKIVEN